MNMLIGQAEEELEGTFVDEPRDIQPSMGDTPEEAVVSMFAMSSNPHISVLKFKGQIGHKPICALIDNGSTHSFIHPIVLQGLKCHISNTAPMVVMMASGDKLVIDTKCADLHFTLQQEQFTSDIRILGIQGYDLILGLDWLKQFDSVQINWKQQRVSFQKDNKEIMLQMQPEITELCMCEVKEIEKELKAGNEVLLAQVMMICSVPTNNPDSSTDSEEVQLVLQQYQDVFSAPSLPPVRQYDHQIFLEPNAHPINLRPYRYSHYQKLELEKIIDELLQQSIIQPSSSPYTSPVVLVKKKDGS